MTATKVGTITAIQFALLEDLDFEPGCDWPNCTDEATHKMVRATCGCVTFYCGNHADRKRADLGHWSGHWTCLRCNTRLGAGWGVPEIVRFSEL